MRTISAGIIGLNSWTQTNITEIMAYQIAAV